MILWTSENEGHTRRVLREAESITPDDASEPADESPVLVPLQDHDQGIGALFVPHAVQGEVTHNGIALPAGFHILKHADQFVYDNRRFWVAVKVQVESESYQPDVHGQDQFCFVTKARLEEGEEILNCPGRPGAPCVAVYRRAVWEKALAANPQFRCPGCGFDPNGGDWEPPTPRASNLQRLFDLAEEHSA